MVKSFKGWEVTLQTRYETIVRGDQTIHEAVPEIFMQLPGVRSVALAASMGERDWERASEDMREWLREFEKRAYEAGFKAARVISAEAKKGKT